MEWNITQFCSVTQLRPTLCDPIDCSTPDFPVHHQLPELTQTQVYRVSDAIQPSHPTTPSPPTFSLSQLITQPQEKNEIMTFVATWMDLEVIIQSKSVRERQMPYMIFMCNLKKIMNLFIKQKQIHRYRTNLPLPKREKVGG